MWCSLYAEDYLRKVYFKRGEDKDTYILISFLYFTQSGKMFMPVDCDILVSCNTQNNH